MEWFKMTKNFPLAYQMLLLPPVSLHTVPIHIPVQ